MRQEFDNISCLVGNREILENIECAPTLPLFSEKVLNFFDSLSKQLMSNSRAKEFPDVIAFAFWIRRASLEKARQQYVSDVQRLGRGVAFHIAPSNIPVQFAVSMTYAMISGNASVIRVSQKNFDQVDIICEVLRSILSDAYPELARYICVIRYEHDDRLTQLLTDLCDIRMIWGGDQTIAAIRRASIPPRCIDLGFADRYSLAVIRSEDYLEGNIPHLANDFYNDTYLFDQNACSAPRLVVWTGGKIDEAKKVFWESLNEIVSRKYTMDPIKSSEKLLRTAVCSAKYPDIREVKTDNLIVRVELPKLYDTIMEDKGNCGYFFEYSTGDLREIVPILKKGCQTITYIGEIEEDIRRIITECGVRGVDRIVPVGRGANLSFVWDGLDLPNVLSRQISNE